MSEWTVKDPFGVDKFYIMYLLMDIHLAKFDLMYPTLYAISDSEHVECRHIPSRIHDLSGSRPTNLTSPPPISYPFQWLPCRWSHYSLFKFSAYVPDHDGELSDTEVLDIMTVFASCKFSGIELDGDFYPQMTQGRDFIRDSFSWSVWRCNDLTLPHFRNLDLTTALPSLKLLVIRWFVNSGPRSSATWKTGAYRRHRWPKHSMLNGHSKKKKSDILRWSSDPLFFRSYSTVFLIRADIQ